MALSKEYLTVGWRVGSKGGDMAAWTAEQRAGKMAA